MSELLAPFLSFEVERLYKSEARSFSLAFPKLLSWEEQVAWSHQNMLAASKVIDDISINDIDPEIYALALFIVK